MPTLLCPVRNCHLPLAREERRLVCERGHSFDLARSGYANLLQPQERRSASPGDSAAAVAARRRFFDRGLAAPLDDAINDLLQLRSASAVLDAGCGEGHHLASVAARFGCSGCGVDISLPAIEAAAKRHRDLQWIVANADRFIPYAEASFDCILSITARMNASEFRRVIRGDGVLLIAIPAPDDLLELREKILGQPQQRDRRERTIEEFSEAFSLGRQERVRWTARLDHASIEDVMTSSYRGLRTRERERLGQSGETDVTLSRDVLVFRPLARRVSS